MTAETKPDGAPTQAASWNGQTTVTVTLPSGNTAELRKSLPVYLMLRTGQFTGEMFAAYNEWAEGRLSDPALAGDLIDLMVRMMFVNPKVTSDGADGTLAIDQLDDGDIDMVLEMAGGGQPTTSFPDGPADRSRGDDRPSVEGDAVKPARAAGGKSGGAQRRQPARRKRSGGS